MAGLYVHIPFCRQACHYCNFHFSTTLKRVPQMMQAILRELRLRRDEHAHGPIETVYFGGGTPSLLSTDQLDALFHAVLEHYEVVEGAEWTLEANPDDLTPARLAHLAAGRVNRLSVGIQAFEDAYLQALNRSHNAAQARSVIAYARAFGFHDLTADLIYGQPGMSLADWQEQLRRLLDLELPHFSGYALTVEPQTALAHMIGKGKVQMPDDGLVEDQFHYLSEAAAAAGYEHYEISSFALPGHRSRHNSGYWQGVPYIGIGPGAHSYDGISRRWNVANNATYIAALENGGSCFEQEELTEADRYHEWIMTGLRLMNGVELLEAEQFSPGIREHFHEESRRLLSTGDLEELNGHLRVAPWRRFKTDGIASNLFLIPEE